MSRHHKSHVSKSIAAKIYLNYNWEANSSGALMLFTMYSES